MDAPSSTEIDGGHPAWRVLAALDTSSKLGVVCVAFGWFFMNTLVVNLGSLQHGVRFLDMPAVIADPTRLFFDAETPVVRTLFVMVCLGCLAGPLVAHLAKSRHAWTGYLAPLVLMLICGVLLYCRTSGEWFSQPADPASLTGSLVHMANDLVHRGSDLITRHVSIGAGSYLAMIGALVLAFQGRKRRPAPNATG